MSRAKMFNRFPLAITLSIWAALRVSAVDGSWVALRAMTEARQEIGVGVLGGKIYTVGGLPSTNHALEYDPATNEWRFIASLPLALDHVAVASVGAKLYVIGGFSSSGNSDTLFEYNPDTDRWAARASMPTARGGLAAAVIGGRIYAVGGASALQNELEVYDPASDSWKRLAPMPTGRNHLAAGAIKGKLYVAGGRPGNLAVLEVYDPQTNSWTTREPMPTGRSGHGGAVVGDKFYTFGGEGNSASTSGIFPQSEVYDPTTDTWKALEQMRTPRHGIGGAVIGNRIYIPGGATQEGLGGTNAHDAFVVQPEKLYFAHFVSGARISSELLFSNLSETQPILMTVEFWDQSGNPLPADFGGVLQSKTTLTVQPLGAASLRSSDAVSNVKVGSVLVSSDGPASGTILFSSTLAGFRGMAGIAAGPLLTRFLAPVQREPFNSNSTTGIAVSNPSESKATVQFTLRNQSGAVLSRRELTLGARSQMAAFLEQIFPDADIVRFSFRGTVTATSTVPVSSIAMLFTGNDFAALPVSPY